jgi:hypothetical protein
MHFDPDGVAFAIKVRQRVYGQPSPGGRASDARERLQRPTKGPALPLPGTENQKMPPFRAISLTLLRPLHLC